MVWPKAGATDVPIDTTIVVSRYYVDGDTNIIKSSLATADGTDVPLAEINRLPPPWRGCGALEVLFLRPEQPLKPGETYTLTIASGEKGMSSQSAFTAGEQMTAPEPEINAQITYLKVFTTAVPDYANLRVDLDQPPNQPLWLRAQGSFFTQNTNGWTFSPKGWSDYTDQHPEYFLPPVQLSVPLAPADDCIELQIFGVQGSRLLEERRCRPDRCAVYSIVAATTSAGTPGGSPVDVEQISDGSCDDPPVLQSGPGGIDYSRTKHNKEDDGDFVANTAGAPKHSSDESAAFGWQAPQSNCSVTSPGSTSFSGCLIFLFMAFVCLPRRCNTLRCPRRGVDDVAVE